MTELHLPEDISFSCHQCGLCCSIFPSIPLDDLSARTLLQCDLERIPAARQRLTDINDAVVAELRGESGLALRKSPDGACVFHREDKLCELHHVYGAQTKPQTCRDFPFRYRAAPDGVYVGLSFVCPSVRANEGAPITQHRPALEEARVPAFGKSSVSEPVLLNPHISLSWKQYLAIEECMIRLLADRRLPLGRRLVACNILLGFLDGWFRIAHGAHAPMDAARSMPDKTLDEFLAAVNRSDFADIRRAASRSIRSPLLIRMFLGMVTSYGNLGGQRPRGRCGLVAGLIGQYARHALGTGGVRLSPLAYRATHSLLKHSIFPSDGPALELVGRYLRHCVFRKDLVHVGTLTNGLNRMIINAALIRWYSAALAGSRHHDAPTYDDYSDAVLNVEKYYGFHSRVYQYFSEHALLDEIMSNFMGRKNYPFIMLAD
ncbi:MAG: YkgJ family cysteine cluster protein [Candidatus Sumerlaeota bacterium]|nr:YkgJ family cysteine cluster protein [Candidatus Sumerlaeota bacterium]